MILSGFNCRDVLTFSVDLVVVRLFNVTTRFFFFLLIWRKAILNVANFAFSSEVKQYFNFTYYMEIFSFLPNILTFCKD